MLLLECFDTSNRDCRWDSRQPGCARSQDRMDEGNQSGGGDEVFTLNPIGLPLQNRHNQRHEDCPQHRHRPCSDVGRARYQRMS